MSQNLPPLMPQQEQLPTFNLSATKYAMVNPIYNVFKENIPSNLRLLGKSIFNPSKVTEQNFTPEEIRVLQQTFLGSENRMNTERAQNWKPRLKELSLNKNRNEADQAEYEYAMRNFSPTIQYPDYPISSQYQKYGVGNMPMSASFKDKGYALSTALGRANYYTDPQGAVHIVDQYNFPQGSGMSDYKYWNLPFKIAHAIGERFSRPMPVDINLGKRGD